MSMSLLGWRRTVAAVYRRVRAEPDPERAWWIWRDARDRLFATHPDSPIPGPDRGRFTGLRYAPYDPALRYELPVDDAEPTRIEVPTATDGVVPFVRVGALRIPDLGSLDVWWLDSYGGGIFVPVRDPNPETYGGGRYLVDTVKGADLGSASGAGGGGDLGGVDTAGGREPGGGGPVPGPRGAGGSLTIDLNFAYNPSCAYDSRWVCPLAPPGNVLSTAVNAGELGYLPG